MRLAQQLIIRMQCLMSRGKRGLSAQAHVVLLDLDAQVVEEVDVVHVVGVLR